MGNNSLWLAKPYPTRRSIGIVCWVVGPPPLGEREFQSLLYQLPFIEEIIPLPFLACGWYFPVASLAQSHPKVRRDSQRGWLVVPLLIGVRGALTLVKNSSPWGEKHTLPIWPVVNNSLWLAKPYPTRRSIGIVLLMSDWLPPALGKRVPILPLSTFFHWGNNHPTIPGLWVIFPVAMTGQSHPKVLWECLIPILCYTCLLSIHLLLSPKIKLDLMG